MGKSPSKALSPEDEALSPEVQKKESFCPFPNDTIPRRSRTKRSMSMAYSYDVLIGQKKVDTFLEENSEIHDPGYPNGPIKKKYKMMIEFTAEQSKKDSVVNQPPRRRKKRKQKADDSNDDVYVPRFRVRGGSRGNRRANSLNSGMLGSKTFQERMEHIWSTCPGERRKSFSYLDCLWFHLHSQKDSKAKVLSWAEKKKDAFSKQYVFVPIVIWSHWSLLVLCNFGDSHQSPCMLLLDSLQTANPKRLEPLIRKFVSDLYNIEQRPGKVKSSCKIPLLVPKVPQQRDGEECGRLVLYYVNLFLQRAPEEFSLSKGYPYFMKEDWFKFEDFDNFCKRLEVESKANDVSSSDEDVVEVSSEQSFVIG